MNDAMDDPSDIVRAKREMRMEIKALTAFIRGDARMERSRALQKIFSASSSWKKATWVGLFSPMADEPDVSFLMKDAWADGKRVAVPVYEASRSAYWWAEWKEDSKVMEGKFGIREPEGGVSIDGEKLDLVMVPGVAFDVCGGRLGRGRGYYDRLLRRIRAVTCGVGYDEQIVPSVPVEMHDVKLGELLTPTRWLQCVQRPI